MISGIRSKISFELGRNPRIAARPESTRKYVPREFDCVLLISADFELAWAWRYAIGKQGSLPDPLQFARQARQNIPLILDLCDTYRIPITWGTVGHLFLDSCRRSEKGMAHASLSRLPYFRNEWWAYESGDWFDADPCSSLESDNAWYAPDLIEKILASRAGHEIGCHTFSHIDCSDAICPEKVIVDELKQCQEAAAKFGVRLESFIFPGHTMGNFEAIKKCGFTSVRTNYLNEIGYPVKDEFGLWRFPASAEMIRKPAWSLSYNLYRYRKMVERATRNKAVLNLWFHPSMPTADAPGLFEGIFRAIRQTGKKCWVTTMREYRMWLDEQ